MRYDDLSTRLRAELSRAYGEPIEAAVLVHRNPDQRRRDRRGGPKIGRNAHLALTPTRLRLHRLGGRSGVQVRDEALSWDRRTVRVEVGSATRTSSGTVGYDWDVHALRISGPEGDVELDVVAENHLMDPEPEVRRLREALGR